MQFCAYVIMRIDVFVWGYSCKQEPAGPDNPQQLPIRRSNLSRVVQMRASPIATKASDELQHQKRSLYLNLATWSTTLLHAGESRHPVGGCGVLDPVFCMPEWQWWLYLKKIAKIGFYFFYFLYGKWSVCNWELPDNRNESLTIFAAMLKYYYPLLWPFAFPLVRRVPGSRSNISW